MLICGSLAVLNVMDFANLFFFGQLINWKIKEKIMISYGCPSSTNIMVYPVYHPTASRVDFELYAPISKAPSTLLLKLNI